MMVFKRVWPALVALVWPLWPVWAQTPSPPPVNPEQREALQRWREVNEQVGEFPRGHIDLLKWERTNLSASASPTMAGTPLSIDELVRRSLLQKPELFGPQAANPLVARERQMALVTHVVQVRQAWMDAVMAAQAVTMQQARSEVADSGAELGRRMVKAGNWSQARQLREQVTQAREAMALRQAQMAEREALERLALELGRGRAAELTELAARLPAELPAPPSDLGMLSAEAVEANVLAADPLLAQLRQMTDRKVQAVPSGLLQQHAQARETSLTSLPAGRLPTAPLVIADTRLTRDHTLGETAQAQAKLASAENERRSQAREAWGKLQDLHAMAQQTQGVLLPLIAAQEQETLLRYNGMLQSTWDLLEATRERLGASMAAAQARHAYWTAQLDWELLLAGGPYRASKSNAPSASAGTAAKDH